jgi:spermidine synthase
MTRALVLGLTTLTGFSGLVYEVAWEKYLATLLGSHSEATAAVLGLFLGGLAVGYALFGWVTRRRVAAGHGARLLLLYGAVEGAIGLHVLVFPILFEIVHGLSAALSPGATGLGFVVDVLLSALLIGPPAVLMGGTIPILTQVLPRDASDATRFHALVYAWNTAGAFVGALAAGFVLIPWLGLVHVMVAMGLVNLSAGAVFALLGLRGTAPRVDDGATRPVRVEARWAYSAAALLTGYAMMSLQTILIRVGGLSLGASQFTFSMVVAVFVLCIALGSFGVGIAKRVPHAALAICQWSLVALLFVLYAWLPHAPYAAHVVRSLFRDVDAAFHAYYAALFLGVLLLIGPVVVLSGATLPLIFDHLRRRFDDLGHVAGALYSWNTVGSLLGALLGGYALLFWLDLDQVYGVALLAQTVAALLLGWQVGGGARRASPWIAGVALIGLVAIGGWEPTSFAHGLFRTRQPIAHSYDGRDAMLAPYLERHDLVFYDDDPIQSVAVTEQESETGGVSRSIVNNGKSDGNTELDYPTMGLAALLPALLADRAERAFVIGFGTGVSVGELMVLPTMERVVVSEISPGVVAAAPYFDFANQGVTRSEKVEMLRTDAYRALIGSDQSFDVIVSEPSNPWVQGIEMLFSREFLEAARDRLRPGGVYAQWYHQYETDAASVELVLRTYAAVFDRVSVWYGLGPDLLLLGFQDEADPLDVERLARRVEEPVFRAGLARSGVASLAELLAHEILPLGVVRAAGLEGPVHSLYRPILGYRAARAFFRGARGELPFTGFGEAARVGRRNALLARYPGALRPEDVFEGFCSERWTDCVALLARWERAGPSAEATAARVRLANERVGGVGTTLTVPLVRSVARLVGPPPADPSGGPIPLEEAELATRQYVRFYSHALPFSPDALRALWRRCADPPDRPGACETGRAEVERLLADGTPLTQQP